MTLYLGTPVRATKTKDIKSRAELMLDIVGDAHPTAFEVWQFTAGGMDDLQHVNVQRASLLEVLGKRYADDHFISVQSRRKTGLGIDPFRADSYFNILTPEGRTNLESNAKAARELDAAQLVFAPHTVFQHPEGYSPEFEDPSYRQLLAKQTVSVAKEVSTEYGVPILVEQPTIPLWGNLDNRREGTVHQAGFAYVEDLRPIPGEMLAFDICHYVTAQYAARQTTEGLFVPAAMNPGPQPSLLEALKTLQPRELHINDLGKETWLPDVRTFAEGLIPGDGAIGVEGYKNVMRLVKERASAEDIVAIIEVEDKDFSELNESKESLKRVVDWLR